MRLLVATTNLDKLREIRSSLSGAPVELVALNDLDPIDEPEETGDTFRANARLKAFYYAARSGVTTVAEDSGLCIDALNGEPGVRSARFLRPDATYPERFAEIVRRLDARPGQTRAARFVCAVALVEKQSILFETEGTVEGEVADVPRGTRGFGYDPIFFYPPFQQTLAEVSDEDKLSVAHRGKAFRALSTWLRQRHA